MGMKMGDVCRFSFCFNSFYSETMENNIYVIISLPGKLSSLL